jgi:hypothetical protein
MFHEPAMADLALRLTQQHLLGATPVAPVVEHRPRSWRRLLRSQVRVAGRPRVPDQRTLS